MCRLEEQRRQGHQDCRAVHTEGGGLCSPGAVIGASPRGTSSLKAESCGGALLELGPQGVWLGSAFKAGGLATMGDSKGRTRQIGGRTIRRKEGARYSSREGGVERVGR